MEADPKADQIGVPESRNSRNEVKCAGANIGTCCSGSSSKGLDN